MNHIFVDPSYKGSGFCIVNTDKHTIRFALISEGQTKRAFINYFEAAKNIQLKVMKLLENYPPENTVIYQELPFPNGMSSAGLFGLQFLMYALYKSKKYTVKGIPPSFVSNATKKFMEVKKETTSTRKEACQKNKLWLEKAGYTFENPLELKKAGADVATAMLFFTESMRQKRSWPILLDKGVCVLQELPTKSKKS